MKGILTTLVAIIAGLLVLAGMLLRPMLDSLLAALLQLALILVSVAVLIGIINLVSMHWMRVRHREKKSVYSFVVIAAFLITILAGILLGPNSVHFSYVVTGIQYPIETSLMSLTAVSLVFACLSLIRRKQRSLFVYLFLGSTIFFLMGSIGLLKDINNPVAKLIIDMFGNIPLGGVRGLLIGMALGSLITGIRILTGVDRSYAD